MCYYNGVRVTRAEFIRLKQIEKAIKQIKLLRKVQPGFLYQSWPVILPINGGQDYDLRDVHWEYIPENIEN